VPSTPDRLDLPFGDPLVRELFPPLATGVHWGLERTRAALSDLGDPHKAYPSIHVGGTNGKGSVASTVHAVLDSAEGAGRLRSGLYTSPHLCSFTERFRIGGGPVAEETLVRYAEGIREVVLDRELTFFEAITVLGFHLFARENAEILAAEVGLGGRLDATNVLEPVCSAITNVALDHAEYLGGTRAEIAREKAGIIKPGVPVVTAETDPEIVSILQAIAAERRAPLTLLDPGRDLLELDVAPDHTAFTLRTRTWGTLRLRTPLVGRHQAANAALALMALEHLPPGLRPDRSAVVRGVASVQWPGRDQVEIVDDQTWLLDVAHNTAGVASLVDTLARLTLPGPQVALVGVLGDKDWRAMLPPLFHRCADAVFTVPPSAPEDRRWDPKAVARELAEVGEGILVGEGKGGTPAAPVEPTLCRFHVVPDFSQALARARGLAGKGTVVVTGSVHTVGNALQLLERTPWGR
jgi:dihydrofolate synthase/folylpolyglutamate synthase